MPRKNTLQTPEDFLELAPPGGSVLLILPNAYVARRFVPAFLGSSRKASRLAVFDSQPGSSSEAPSAHVTATVDSFRSTAECLRALVATGRKRDTSVVLDLSGGTPGWLSSSDSRDRFVRATVEGLRSTRCRSLLILTENLLDPSHWTRLKGMVSSIAILRATDDELYCQVIATAGRLESERFLPRMVRIQDGRLVWGGFLVPTPDAGTPDERIERLKDKLRRAEAALQHRFEKSPYPQAVMSPRRILAVNAAFRESMPWTIGEDGEAVVTPHQLFGRRNSGLLHEIFPPLEGEEPSGDEQDGGGMQPGAVPEVRSRPAQLIRDVSLPVKDSPSLDFELSVLRLPSEDRAMVLCTFVPMGVRQSVISGLRASASYLKSLLGAPSGAVIVVRDGRIVYASQGFLTLFGYLLSEDIAGSDVSRIAAGRDRRGILESLAMAGESESPVLFDFVGLNREGGRLHLSASASGVSLEGEKAVVCYIFDRSAEVAAVEERERRQWESETLQRLLVVIREPDRFVDLAGAALDYLVKRLGADGGGAYAPDADSTSLVMVASRELSPRLIDTLSRLSRMDGLGGFVVRTLEPLVLSIPAYPAHLPHRNLFEAEGYNALILIPLQARGSFQGLVFLASRRAFDAEVSSAGLMGGIADQLGAAAARVHILDRVRASELMFRTAAESVKDLVYQAFPNGVFRFIGPQVVALCGYQPGEIMRGPDNWRNIVHPDDRAEYSRRITAGAQGMEGIDLEYRILPKGKAAYRWVRDSVRYLRAQDGTVESINGIVTDITEHIELERRLSRSEELKRRTIESVQEGVAVFNTDLECVDWNQAMEVMTGRSRGEMVGKNADESPLPMAELKPRILRALRGERVSAEDIAVPTADGVGRWIMWARFSPLRDEEGEVRGVVGTISDVTSRKSLEVEVRESEETLRNVIDAMSDALLIAGQDGCVWEVNRGFTEATGYSRAEVLGTAFPYPWVVEEDMSEFVRRVGKLGVSGSLRDYNMRWRRKDGGVIDVSIGMTMVNDVRHASVAMVSIARDITRRRSMEVEISNLYAELKAQMSTLTRLYELASDLAGAVDAASLFDVMCRHVPALLPADSIALYGRSASGEPTLTVSGTAGASSVTRHEGPDAVVEADVRFLIESVSASGEPMTGEAAGRGFLAIPVKSSGRFYEVVGLRSARVADYTPDHLRLAGSIGSLTGIAMDRIRLHDAMFAKSREIETRNRELDDFAYVVSHDLKEPLITIEGYAKILEADYAGRLDDEGAQFLGSIRRAGARMKNMIEDLLTLARVGRADSAVEDVPLQEVVRDVLEDLEFSIREKRASVSLPGDLPTVRFDRAQLGIVFRNLISNALKFNTGPEPSVEISATADAREVIVAVADNGIGIERDQHDRIFRIFQRVHPGDAFDGTGAGLAIVRSIVEHRGGRIWLESTVGSGSTFLFSIPRR